MNACSSTSSRGKPGLLLTLQQNQTCLTAAIHTPLRSAVINDQTKLPRWLDDNLFHGATMLDLEHERPKHIHIYASDLHNRHPFVFSRATFDAICSDYDSYPLSTAVAASAAVPFVFSPIVLQTFPDHCQTTLPAWIDRAINNREESQLLRSAAQGLRRNRDPNQVRYVKLVDGGLSDNFGVTSFIVERAKHQTPYSPLSPEHAVKFRRALFLVANAGVDPSASWSKSIEGPAGIDMVNAISDTAIQSNVRPTSKRSGRHSGFGAKNLCGGAARSQRPAFRNCAERWRAGTVVT